MATLQGAGRGLRPSALSAARERVTRGFIQFLYRAHMVVITALFLRRKLLPDIREREAKWGKGLTRRALVTRNRFSDAPLEVFLGFAFGFVSGVMAGTAGAGILTVPVFLVGTFLGYLVGSVSDIIAVPAVADPVRWWKTGDLTKVDYLDLPASRVAKLVLAHEAEFHLGEGEEKILRGLESILAREAEAEQEIARALLPEWEGDVKGLLTAARTLAH